MIDDLDVLSAEQQARAKADANGELSWHVADVASVLGTLADAGRVVLGLDVRRYDEDGSFVEVAWSDYSGTNPSQARVAALEALSRNDLPGDWVVVTW